MIARNTGVVWFLGYKRGSRIGRIAIWLKPLDQGCHARDLSALWGVTWVKLYAQSIMIKALFDTRKSVRCDGGFMNNHWDVMVIGRLYRLFFGCLDYNIRLWLWRAYGLQTVSMFPNPYDPYMAYHLHGMYDVGRISHPWSMCEMGWNGYIIEEGRSGVDTRSYPRCEFWTSPKQMVAVNAMFLCVWVDVQAQGIAPSAKLPKNRSNLTSFAGQQALGSLLCGSSKELQPGRRPGPQCALGGVANWTDWMVQYDIYLWGFGIFHHDPESKIFPWKTCWKSWIMALSATVCRWLFGQRMKWFRWTINKHVLCNGPLKFTQRLIQITYSYLMLHKSYIVGHSYSSIMLHNIL